MNKKLLFAAMSLAALTACTDKDFESQKVAEEVGSVQFEVLNNNDAFTRASMDGNTIVWNADEGDLFTLYHGAAGGGAVTGFENAAYKAVKSDEGATLSTPTMIKEGRAIMVWPVDTAFRVKPADNLTLMIPVELTNIENNIPYVSDLVNIAGYNKKAPYNTAGKDRKYPIYMRPMASQLNLKADWVKMDKIKALTELPVDPIAPITLTSVKLQTKAGGNTEFTTVLPVKFTDPTGAITDQWDNAHTNRAWEKVTDFNLASTDLVKSAELTTKCIVGTESCKFLILPQAEIDPADATKSVEDAAIIVNTYYGQVVVAKNGVAGSQYNDATEYATAWYRYLSEKPATDADGETTPATKETAGEGAGKYKTTANIEKGLKQTINFFSNYKNKKDGSVVKGEPQGTAVTRYVKVYLNHLDMSGLHITSDKQLRDVVRVWKELGLPAVEVILDGDKTKHEFEISQQTIAKINEINGSTLNFKVKPCSVPHVDGVDDEFCNTIVITGGGDVKDIAFIAANGTQVADVAFNAGETWNWKGAVKVTKAGVNRFINRGTMVNTEGAILKTTENDGTQNNVVLVNNGTWNISGGKLFVQFNVTNMKDVNIAKGAEYRQDKSNFTNFASDIPTRFDGDDSKIGKVVNKGVFATVNGGKITNVGLIKHDDIDAKTYITANQIGGNFAAAFGGTNKIGTIDLPYSNKEEDNISIDAAADEGFVSVTVSAGDAPADGILNADVVGARVNYINIIGGVKTIAKVSAQVKYVEINDEEDKEIAWSLTDPAKATYEGLMVLSPVNIKLNTEIEVTKACYLGADMYVGGKFYNGTWPTLPSWSGYFGDTSANFATMYVTYK